MNSRSAQIRVTKLSRHGQHRSKKTVPQSQKETKSTNDDVIHYDKNLHPVRYF